MQDGNGGRGVERSAALIRGPRSRRDIFIERGFEMNVKSIRNGVYGGLAGGVVFGGLMGMMGMLAMIGGMVGHASALTGFFVHMMMSAMIGAVFALTLGRFATDIKRGIWQGLLYGGAWWVLGPLTVMPLLMGMDLGASLNVSAAAHQMPSLMGHLMYGAILGTGYAWLEKRALFCAEACAS